MNDDEAYRGFLSLPASDPAVKLTPEERASIRRGFDVDALERLLALAQPWFRQRLLASFQWRKPGELPPNEFRTPFTYVGDPALNEILHEVWAPWWDDLSDEWLNAEDMPYPGKEIARQRRAVRRAG